MTPTHDVKQALELVAAAERPTPGVAADLARAQAAGRSRSRRRFRLGLAGLAVVAAAGVGVGSVLNGCTRPTRTTPAVTAPSGVQLVAETFDAAPYTFDLTPTGWSVQGQRPQAVTIAPDDGSTSSHPDDFRGKLVIMFDANEPHGETVEHDGRTFLGVRELRLHDHGGAHPRRRARRCGAHPVPARRRLGPGVDAGVPRQRARRRHRPARRSADRPTLDAMQVLARDVWTARAAAHASRVDAFVAPHLARRSDRVKHPVHDFLFTYYSQRPAQLRRWHPGYGVALADAP